MDKGIEVNTHNLIRSSFLDKIRGVVHGFGTRGIKAGDHLDVLEVKDRFIMETNQTHGDTVHYLMWPAKKTSFSSKSGGSETGTVLEGDAFITDRPGMVCFVRTADCVPILIADKDGRGVAAIHAGWRGTALGVVRRAICAMRDTLGIDPLNCVAAIGPSICGKCYEVGSEVVEDLSKLNIEDSWKIDDTHVDLSTANHLLLVEAGIPKENIDRISICTFEDERFASYRRDNSEEERQFSFIVIAG